jgi:hypothetical protein
VDPGWFSARYKAPSVSLDGRDQQSLQLLEIAQATRLAPLAFTIDVNPIALIVVIVTSGRDRDHLLGTAGCSCEKYPDDIKQIEAEEARVEGLPKRNEYVA